ncbi:MAG: hypothetical protein ACXWTH_06340, partial [Methylosarcina sp.]
RRHRWADRALLLGGMTLGLLLLPGIFQPSLWVFAGLWFMNGSGQAFIEISSATLLAEHSKETQRGSCLCRLFCPDARLLAHDLSCHRPWRQPMGSAVDVYRGGRHLPNDRYGRLHFSETLC